MTPRRTQACQDFLCKCLCGGPLTRCSDPVKSRHLLKVSEEEPQSPLITELCVTNIFFYRLCILHICKMTSNVGCRFITLFPSFQLDYICGMQRCGSTACQCANRPELRPEKKNILRKERLLYFLEPIKTARIMLHKAIVMIKK